jgi:subtilisin family serine protease
MAAGQSFVGGDANIDPNGHGTALAGIAAASVNNGIGIAGVAYAGASVSSVQVLGPDGIGLDSDVIAGVVWAADNGAKVILMGFSSPGLLGRSGRCSPVRLG